jgi:uncharacterized protein YabN with tetrapyrrole methylase and pyrophosphatase domain
LLHNSEFRVLGWPEQLRQQALAATREALNAQQAGTQLFDLQKVADQVMEHFRVIYEREERKTRLVTSGLSQIRRYLDKLMTNWEFDRSTDTVARELQEPIRDFLKRELDGGENEDVVASLVRRRIRQELGI